MNNSKIVYNQEEDTDRLSILQKNRGELIQVVEAINRVEANEDWKKLKKLVLDGVVTTLERQLQNEMVRKELNAPEIYRLQGQLGWARKYIDLKKLGELFKKQVENINYQLNEQKTPRDGAL